MAIDKKDKGGFSNVFYKITGIDLGGSHSKENAENKHKSKLKRTTSQQTIPYIKELKNGIFEITKNVFSKSYRFEDINYLTAEEEEEERILTQYRDFINYFNPNMQVAVTLFNRRVNTIYEEKGLIIPLKKDRLDKFRDEFNNFLVENYRNGRNAITQDKIITVSMNCKDKVDAKNRFDKLDRNLILNLQKTGTRCRPIETNEKLELLHDFYRNGKEGQLDIDEDNIKRQGITAKDLICPDEFYFEKDYMIIGDIYYKAVFINNLPANIVDTFLQEINDFDFSMITTLSFKALNKKKAGRMIRNKVTGMEANKYDIQKKNSQAGVDPDMIPFDLRNSLDEAYNMLEDTTSKNEKVFQTALTMLISGKSKEDLENNVNEVSDIVSQHVCELQTLKYQQEEGLNQTLPFAHDLLNIRRTLTSSSVAVFAPFTTQECNHKGGITYGRNAISKKILRINKEYLKNRNGFVLGKPGSGKSMFEKIKNTEERLRFSNDTIIIVDPEGEYVDWCTDMGGQVIEISPSSRNRINPCDCNENYGIDEDGRPVSPINFKADYLLSLFQAMINGNNKQAVSLDPILRGFLDQAIRLAYKDYEDHNYNENYLPNMKTIKDILKSHEDKRAKDLAIVLDYYVGGSANLFAEETEIDIHNKLIVFNLLGLPKQLKTLGCIIVLDQIWNILVSNWEEGKITYVDIDEISILFKNDLVGEILQEYWRRGRKWGAEFTGLTQNIEEIKKSEIAITMFSNSEFVALLGQSETDIDIIQDIYKLSDTQREYLLSATTGSGIIVFKQEGMKNRIIPFECEFPKNTELYSLMTSKMEEVKQRKQKRQGIMQKLLENQAKEIQEFEDDGIEEA